MGSSISPVVGNIFMEHFEVVTLETYHLKPKFWKQFVDDTFAIQSHNLLAL